MFKDSDFAKAEINLTTDFPFRYVILTAIMLTFYELKCPLHPTRSIYLNLTLANVKRNYLNILIIPKNNSFVIGFLPCF